jgi:hypothetical protein
MSAIAATPRPGVNEFLDERTGATVTVVREPLIFALERSTLAAHARDYISLTAVEVDRSGQTQLCVIGYFWSTIDRRAGSGAAQPADKTLALFAADRLIRFTLFESPPKDLQASAQLHAPETAHFEQAAYKVSLEELRYIAASQALKDFVARISPSR